MEIRMEIISDTYNSYPSDYVVLKVLENEVEIGLSSSERIVSVSIEDMRNFVKILTA